MTKRRRRKKRGLAGFSLIESVISGVLLVVGLTGIVSSLGTILKLHEHNNKMTAAIHAGQLVMEGLLLRYQDDSQMQVGGPYSGPSFDLDLSTGSVFSTSWTVSAGPIADTRLVTVSVDWTEARGDKTVTFSTVRP